MTGTFARSETSAIAECFSQKASLPDAGAFMYCFLLTSLIEAA